MPILIDNKQSHHPIPALKISKIAQTVLNVLDCPDSELSILIIDDSQMSDFNATYLNKNGPTNVIAFAMREGKFTDINPYVIGDVVISIDTAERESRSEGISMFCRFVKLLIHGILHLTGYDHVNSENEYLEMEKMSEKLLRIVKDDLI